MVTEKLDHITRGKWVVKQDDPTLRAFDLHSVGASILAALRLHLPTMSDAGSSTGGGRVPVGEAEHLSRETIRSPVGHGDFSAGPADPGQLRRDPFRIGSEHRSKHGHHQIEVGVGKRQLFRVAFFKG